MFKTIKCIIFDLDGVLTETSNQHFLAWSTLAEKLGITLKPEFEEHLKGVSRKESLERILDFGSVSVSEEEKEVLMAEKNTHYQTLIKQFTKSNLFDRVEDLLSYIKSKGVLLALGSASKNAPSLLKSLGIKKYFDYIVDPRGKASKPSPDIFLDAMEHFNLTSEQCIGIEDARAGVIAIKKAKMFAIGIGAKEKLPEADIHFTETKELLPYLKNNL